MANGMKAAVKKGETKYIQQDKYTCVLISSVIKSVWTDIWLKRNILTEKYEWSEKTN